MVITEKDCPICPRCESIMQPVWFIEEERDYHNCKTGRKRKALSHFECEWCGKQECVDDSFDGNWYRE